MACMRSRTQFIRNYFQPRRAFEGCKLLWSNSGPMSPVITAANVMQEVDEAARSANSADELMKTISERLHERMLKYNWVGFYMIHDDNGERVLQLGPFVGSMTSHTRI